MQKEKSYINGKEGKESPKYKIHRQKKKKCTFTHHLNSAYDSYDIERKRRKTRTTPEQENMEEEPLKNNSKIRGKNLTLNERTTSCCMVRSMDSAC